MVDCILSQSEVWLLKCFIPLDHEISIAQAVECISFSIFKVCLCIKFQMAGGLQQHRLRAGTLRLYATYSNLALCEEGGSFKSYQTYDLRASTPRGHQEMQNHFFMRSGVSRECGLSGLMYTIQNTKALFTYILYWYTIRYGHKYDTI